MPHIDSYVVDFGDRGFQSLRKLFLRDTDHQIRNNACHERGWSSIYLLTVDYQSIGYIALKGFENLEDRDTLFEYYVTRPNVHWRLPILHSILPKIDAQYIECQTNDAAMLEVMMEYGRDIRAHTYLFGKPKVVPKRDGFVFRKRQITDTTWRKSKDEDGAFVLLYDDIIVADGGYLSHYNRPYVDLYMEVDPVHRGNRYASELVKHLIDHTQANGWKPSARCNMDNKASMKSLLHAGFQKVGYMLEGKI